MKEYLEEEKIEEIKNIDDLIYKALELSINLFLGDSDKSGHSYIDHLMSVYKNVYSKEEKVIALLHDILENKNITKDDLINLGFPNKIVDDVCILTRIKPMEYKDYINNLVKNGSREALIVKLAALKHSMDLSRVKNPTIKDYERIEKRYAPAYEMILNRLEEMKKW